MGRYATGKGANKAPTVVGESTPNRKPRMVLATVALVVVAGFSLWYFLHDEPKIEPEAEPAKPIPQIERVERPRIERPAPRPVEQKPTTAEALRNRYPGLAIPDGWDKPYPPQAYRADGSLMRHSRYVKVITNTVSQAFMSVEERTFTNVADRDIAIALNTEPGEMLVGDYQFGEKFVEDFLKSLETPIEISPEDTEEQKSLKYWVIETKKELKEKYDNGEDIAAIMNETREQYRELGLYREELRTVVEEIKKNNGGELSEKDEVEIIRAANGMLEERGCKPLALPDSFLDKLEQEMEERGELDQQ